MLWVNCSAIYGEHVILFAEETWWVCSRFLLQIRLMATFLCESTLSVLKKVMGFLFGRYTEMRYEILPCHLACVGMSCSQVCKWNWSGLILCVRRVFGSLYFHCTGRHIWPCYTVLAEANVGLERLRATSLFPCSCRMTACFRCTTSELAREVLFGPVSGVKAELQ